MYRSARLKINDIYSPQTLLVVFSLQVTPLHFNIFSALVLRFLHNTQKYIFTYFPVDNKLNNRCFLLFFPPFRYFFTYFNYLINDEKQLLIVVLYIIFT